MTKKAEGQINIRYDKESCVGIVIEELKETRLNLSQMIRDYIMFVKGYEILKNKRNISQEDLQKICLKNLQFFVTQTEITRINLEQEKQYINCKIQESDTFYPSMEGLGSEHRFSSKQEQEFMRNPEPEKIKVPQKKSQTKDLSLINSLLPR